MSRFARDLGRGWAAHALSTRLGEIDNVQGFGYWLHWGVRLRDVLALRSTGAAETAWELLQRSLALARQQGAASWELRTATSLARHWRSHDRAHEARALLEPVRGRFAEGFGTADWQVASRLLEMLWRAAPDSSRSRVDR